MLKSISLDFEQNRIDYVDCFGNAGGFNYKRLNDLSPLIIKMIGLELPEEFGFSLAVTAEDEQSIY